MEALLLVIGSVHWLDDIWLAISFLAGARSPGLAQREFRLRNGAVLRTGEEIQRFAGKRVVTHGWLDGRRVVAKFYLGAFGQWWEWYRGVRGARAFLAAGVPAPAVHYAGYLSAVPAWLTVMDHVDVDEPWPPEGDAMPEEIHFRLLATMAELHARGIQQNDLNAKNFLPSSGRLFAIDGDRARRYGTALSRRRALANLVRFYGGKTAFPEAAVIAGYRYYCEQRQWAWNEVDEQQFLASVRLARRATAERVAARSRRGWKHFSLKRTDQRRSIVDRRVLPTDTQWDRLLPTTVTEQTGHIAKAGEIPLRIRRLAGETLGIGLSPLVLGSRPMRAWTTSILLRRLRLPVERPVAVVEQRLGLLRHEGYLLQQANPQAIPAIAAFAMLPPAARADLIKQIVSLAQRLHALRLTHDNFQLGALIVDRGRVLLLDVEGVRRYPAWLPGFNAVWRRDMTPMVNQLLELGEGADGVSEAFALPRAAISARDGSDESVPRRSDRNS
ncbi:MAG: hypothetical protein JJU06_12895 [Ectothiorhodospiraceae bacterium]|nr:hypothetical protein [Ectothiorhodospiraceae bacterium]MCH8506483.1 lipopolysaccharide kinase InaA family protein [Ectothiorhodospiraceae bacterium]